MVVIFKKKMLVKEKEMLRNKNKYCTQKN